MKKTFSFLVYCCLAQALVAQTGNEPVPASKNLSHPALKGSHRLTFGLGHTRLSQGQINGKTQWVPVASWSLNYDYWLSNKWGIGVQNDLILETFVVEHGNNQLLERNKPLAIIPVGMYKFAPKWSAVVGIGAEYSEGHSLALTRLGIEYGLPLPKNWEISIAGAWDNRWNYYNAWSISFCFSKIWSPHTLH